MISLNVDKNHSSMKRTIAHCPLCGQTCPQKHKPDPGFGSLQTRLSVQPPVLVGQKAQGRKWHRALRLGLPNLRPPSRRGASGRARPSAAARGPCSRHPPGGQVRVAHAWRRRLSPRQVRAARAWRRRLSPRGEAFSGTGSCCAVTQANRSKCKHSNGQTKLDP